jgi:predicted HicB family RNase H-like nuclease
VVYVRVRKTVHEAANTAADEYGVSLSQFVDRALESYLADHFGRQPAQELTLP